MSEIITPSITEETPIVTTNFNPIPEISKLSKDYKFWTRFNQILVIIGGVFSLPIGALAIIGAFKLNKSIEIVDEVNKDAKSQEFVESIKEFHKWIVINFIAAMSLGLLIGIVFGAFFFSLFMAAINKEKKVGRPNSLNPSYNYKKPSDRICNGPCPLTGNSADLNKNLFNDSTDLKNEMRMPVNINTEDASVSMDEKGNMKMVDKDGKVTTVNVDGTIVTDK